MRLVGRLCRLLAATLLLADIGSAAAESHLILSEATNDALQLEPLQVLPDYTNYSPGSVYGLAASVPAVDGDTFVYQPNSQTLMNLSDLPPDERADYACSRKPLEQYGSGDSQGFVAATTQSSTEYVQGTATLRWIDRDPEPVRCSDVPVLIMSRGAIDFGIVDGGNSKNVAVQIGNVGSATLLIGTLSLPPGPFAITGDACSGATLGVGAECTFSVQFSPSSKGPSVSALAVHSNDPLRLTKTLLLAGGYFDDLIFADSFDGPF